MTNQEHIQSMTTEELADFLADIAYARHTPWSDPFCRAFCDNCPAVKCTPEGYAIELELHECDFADGVCPHGSDVVWWLGQEVSNAEA
jgi:hypothetical protein